MPSPDEIEQRTEPNVMWIRIPRVVVVLFAMVVSLFLISSNIVRAEAPPNVLLIMTDDQGWGDIASHGNAQIDTPVLDRLAEQGARFDRFYVSPVCAPTRASLLTGRYHPRTGVHGVTRGFETMRSDEVTIAEVLKSNGYRTGCFGKWHNGAHYPQHPNGQGFDEFVGFCAGHWNNYFDTHLEHNGRPITTEGYIIDVLTDRALEFIEQNKSQAWFCYVPYNTPHSPFQVPDKYFQKYKNRGLDDTLACVHGMVENIDDNVGRLLQKLDQLELAENTIVIFTTDNGPNTNRYNGGMKGRKGSPHEGGVRVPLFIRYPGRIPPGTEVTQITSHIDLLPTIADWVGAALPKQIALDGRSLKPLLDGSDADWPDRKLFANWGLDDQRPGRGAVRTQRWRAVTMNPNRPWELYDMQADPEQSNNVAKKHPDVLAELKSAYESWLKSVSESGFGPIPTEVGHDESPRVTLPGHEAHLHPAKGEGISYHGPNGWANDWIDNWTDREAYPAWPIKIVAAGTYRVHLHYRATQAQLGTKWRVQVGEESLEATVDKPHDPQPIESPDRFARREVYEYQWATLPVGEMSLSPGETQLSIRLVSQTRDKSPLIKAVTLEKVD